MKGIEILTLELKGLNYKISAQRNYEKDIEKISNMSLKEEIGIKDEILKFYDVLKREGDRKVNAKDK